MSKVYKVDNDITLETNVKYFDTAPTNALASSFYKFDGSSTFFTDEQNKGRMYAKASLIPSILRDSFVVDRNVVINAKGITKLYKSGSEDLEFAHKRMAPYPIRVTRASSAAAFNGWSGIQKGNASGTTITIIAGSYSDKIQVGNGTSVSNILDGNSNYNVSWTNTLSANCVIIDVCAGGGGGGGGSSGALIGNQGRGGGGGGGGAYGRYMFATNINAHHAADNTSTQRPWQWFVSIETFGNAPGGAQGNGGSSGGAGGDAYIRAYARGEKIFEDRLSGGAGGSGGNRNNGGNGGAGGGTTGRGNSLNSTNSAVRYSDDKFNSSTTSNYLFFYIARLETISGANGSKAHDGGSTPLRGTKTALHELLLLQRRICRNIQAVMHK